MLMGILILIIIFLFQKRKPSIDDPSIFLMHHRLVASKYAHIKVKNREKKENLSERKLKERHQRK